MCDYAMVVSLSYFSSPACHSGLRRRDCERAQLGKLLLLRFGGHHNGELLHPLLTLNNELSYSLEKIFFKCMFLWENMYFFFVFLYMFCMTDFFYFQHCLSFNAPNSVCTCDFSYFFQSGLLTSVGCYKWISNSYKKKIFDSCLYLWIKSSRLRNSQI